VGRYSAYGAGVGMGAFLHLGPSLCVAAVLRDFTTTPVVWNTDTTDRIRPSALAGLAWIRPVGGGTMTALAAVRTGGHATAADDTAPLMAGMEFAYHQIALRTGVEEGRQSLGVGLKPHSRLQIDWAYAQHDDLPSTQQVSAVFAF